MATAEKEARPSGVNIPPPIIDDERLFDFIITQCQEAQIADSPPVSPKIVPTPHKKGGSAPFDAALEPANIPIMASDDGESSLFIINRCLACQHPTSESLIFGRKEMYTCKSCNVLLHVCKTGPHVITRDFIGHCIHCGCAAPELKIVKAPASPHPAPIPDAAVMCCPGCGYPAGPTDRFLLDGGSRECHHCQHLYHVAPDGTYHSGSPGSMICKKCGQQRELRTYMGHPASTAVPAARETVSQELHEQALPGQDTYKVGVQHCSPKYLKKEEAMCPVCAQKLCEMKPTWAKGTGQWQSVSGMNIMSKMHRCGSCGLVVTSTAGAQVGWI